MLFNTAEFILFFMIVSVLYFVIPRKVRTIWLLIASYFFYMNWNYKYGLLLLFATVSTYICAVVVSNVSTVKIRKLVVLLCVVGNTGTLVYFKYFNFVIDNLNKLLSVTGMGEFHTLDIILPVGISFYIFQALSYLLDVYRNDVPVERNFPRYALFVSFFPQLVAGPIERSGNLLRQIQDIPKKSHFDWDRITHGMTTMVWGFFVKMVIADRIAILVDTVFNNYTNYGSIELLLAAIGFGIQIYCDFSGYSTIAIGSAQVLGFHLMENFEQPYLSGSVKEFWRRWHISLSTWFRDYVYIPLGGSRCSKLRKWTNLMITMGVSGLWHGARWSFVVWGLLHGMYQVAEDMLHIPMKKLNEKIGTKTNVFSYKLLKRLVTFALVDFAWIFFRSNGLRDAARYIKRMITMFDPWTLFDGSLFQLGLSTAEIQVLVCALILLVLVDLVQYRFHKRVDLLLAEQNVWFRYLVLIGMITVIWVYGIYGPAFSSSQFIYFQF